MAGLAWIDASVVLPSTGLIVLIRIINADNPTKHAYHIACVRNGRWIISDMFPLPPDMIVSHWSPITEPIVRVEE